MLKSLKLTDKILKCFSTISMLFHSKILLCHRDSVQYLYLIQFQNFRLNQSIVIFWTKSINLIIQNSIDKNNNFENSTGDFIEKKSQNKFQNFHRWFHWKKKSIEKQFHCWFHWKKNRKKFPPLISLKTKYKNNFHCWFHCQKKSKKISTDDFIPKKSQKTFPLLISLKQNRKKFPPLISLKKKRNKKFSPMISLKKNRKKFPQLISLEKQSRQISTAEKTKQKLMKIIMSENNFLKTIWSQSHQSSIK
jgi:hypothetical protein